MIQRYDPPHDIVPDCAGDYVLYSDYYALELKYTAMLTEIYKLVDRQLHDLGG